MHVGDAVANTGLLGAGMAFAEGKDYQGTMYVRSSSSSNSIASATGSNPSNPGSEYSVRLVVTAMVGKAAAATFAVELSSASAASSAWRRVSFTLTPNISSSCSLGPSSPNHTATCNGLTALTGCSDGCVSSPELG